MRFVWITAMKDLLRLRRDPLSIAPMLVIPVFLAVVMNLVFGGGNAAPQGRLLVADEDQSLLSNLILGAFSRDPLAKMVLVERVDRDQGRKRIDRGDGSAFLIIPKDFGSAYLENRPVRLELFTNPAENILPRIIEETLSIMVDGGYYVQKIGGDQLRSFNTEKAPSDDTVAGWSRSINRLVNSLQKYLAPPLIQVETAVVREATQNQTFATLFFPGMIFMALLFITRALAVDIWKEQTSGTLRRLIVSPAPAGAFLAGRLVFAGVVILAIGLIALLGMRWLAAVPIANGPAALFWLLLSGMVFFLLMLIAVLFCSSRRSADTVGNLVLLPLSIVGGSFFPFELMPDWMARIGKLTPNGWATVQFKAILEGTARTPQLALAASALVLVAGAAFLIALRRLRRGFATV